MTRRNLKSKKSSSKETKTKDGDSDYSPEDKDTTESDSDCDFIPTENDTTDSASIENTNRSFRMLTNKSAYYSHSEDVAIVSYILNRGIHKVHLCEFWKEMAKKLNMDRDWKSLRGRFKRIVPDIDKQHLYPMITKSQAVVLKKLMLPEYSSPVKKNTDDASLTSLTQETRDKVSEWLNSCPTSAITVTKINRENSEKKPEKRIAPSDSTDSESEDSLKLVSSTIVKNHKMNVGEPSRKATKSSEEPIKCINVRNPAPENSSSSHDRGQTKTMGTLLSSRQEQTRSVVPLNSSDEDVEEPKKTVQTNRNRIESSYDSSNESVEEENNNRCSQNLVQKYKKILSLSSSSSDNNYTLNKNNAVKTSRKNTNSKVNVSKNSRIKVSQKNREIVSLSSSSSDDNYTATLNKNNTVVTSRKNINSKVNVSKNNRIKASRKNKEIVSLSIFSSDENYAARSNKNGSFKTFRKNTNSKINVSKNSPIKISQNYSNSRRTVQKSDSSDDSVSTIINLRDRQISARAQNSSHAVKESVFFQNRELRTSQQTKLLFPSKRQKTYSTRENKRQRTDDETIENRENIHCQNCHTQRNYPLETRHHRTGTVSENSERMELHSSPVSKHCSRGNCQFCPSTSKNNRSIQTEEACVKCSQENAQTGRRHLESCSPSKVRFRHDHEIREIPTRDCRYNSNCENTNDRACNINCCPHCDTVCRLNNRRNFSFNRCACEQENRRLDCNCSMCRKCTCTGHLNERENCLFTQRFQRSAAVQTMADETNLAAARNRKFAGDDVQTRINQSSQTRRAHREIDTPDFDDLVENNYSPQMRTEVRNKTSPKRRLRNDEWLCTQKETFSRRQEYVEYKFRCLVCCQLISFSKEYHDHLVIQKFNCDKCNQVHKIVYKAMQIQKLEIPPQEPVVQLNDTLPPKSNYKLGLKKVLNPFACKKPFSVSSSVTITKMPKPIVENAARENLLDNVFVVKDEPVEEWAGDEQTVQRKDKEIASLPKIIKTSKKIEHQSKVKESIDSIQEIERRKENEKNRKGLRDRLHTEVEERRDNRIVYSDTDSMASLPLARIRRNSRALDLPKVVIIRDPILDARCKKLGKHECKKQVLVIRDPILDARCKKVDKHECKKQSCKECERETPERRIQKMLMSPPISCERLSESRLNQYAVSEISSTATDSSRLSKTKKKLFTQPSFEDLDQILSDDNLDTQRKQKPKKPESCIAKPTINVTIEKQNTEIVTEVPNETGGTISDILMKAINKELEKICSESYPVQEKELVNAEPDRSEVESLLEILAEDNPDENLVPHTLKSTTEQNVSKEIELSQFSMSVEGSIGDNGKDTESAVLPEVLNPDNSIEGDNQDEKLDGSCPVNSSKSDFFSCPTQPYPKNENPEIRSRHNTGGISINNVNKHNKSGRKNLRKDFSDILMELDLTQRTSLIQPTNFSDLVTEDEDASEKVDSQIATKDGEINIGEVFSQDLRSYEV